MSNWREKLAQMMQGRYGGNDTLNKWLLGTFLVLLLLAILLQSSLLNLLSVAVLVYAYFRIFSRNIDKRIEENRRFVQFKSQITSGFSSRRTTTTRDTAHRVFSCPQCGQRVRVPRGRGKISITCPKCRHEFIKRS